jgi:hypothetical protein
MDDPTPCYQCLVLAMCKTKVSTYKPRGIRFIQASRVAIMVDCNLFNNYISNKRDIQLCKSRRRLAIHYLTGIDIGVDKDIYDTPTYTIEELYTMRGQEDESYGNN